MGKKIKRICFFSVGFAFNREVRMKFYEKIFPKDVKIFLFTTNKYEGENFHKDYVLKKTKIFYSDYNFFKLPFVFRKFCKENQIERVINIGCHSSGFILLFSTIFSKRDYLLHILGDIFHLNKNNFFNRLKRFLDLLNLFPIILLSKKTITGSFSDYQRFIHFLGEKKIKFLPGPVNTDLFKPKIRDEVRKKLNLSNNKKIAIYVGRLNYLKGFDILLNLIERNPDILFILIGKNEYPDFNKKNFNNVIYLPSIDNKKLVDYYNAADICLFLSRKEGFGFVPREAMSCGTPVLVSEIPSLKILGPAITTPHNLDVVQKKLRNFFNLPKNKKKLISTKSRDYILKECSEDSIKEDYQSVFLS